MYARLKRMQAGQSQSSSSGRGSRGQHAVEHVDTAFDDLEDALGVADAHEVARLGLRQQRGSPAHRLEHRLSVLPHAQTAERVAVEVERGDLLDRAAA